MEDKKQKKLLYNKEYDVSNTVQIRLKLNKKTDADILNRLDVVPNKQGYIKGLIRSDMENEVPPH
jgi:hypothetical protein